MKKIGEIKGVPVVEGNINEVTKNQIHYKEDSGNIQLSKRGNDNKLNSVTGSSSGSSKYAPKYYNIKEDLPDEMKAFFGGFASTVKQVYNKKVFINNALYINSSGMTLIGFSFNPLHTEVMGLDKYIDSMEELGALLEEAGEDMSLLFQYIERITEEEYYKID